LLELGVFPELLLELPVLLGLLLLLDGGELEELPLWLELPLDVPPWLDELPGEDELELLGEDELPELLFVSEPEPVAPCPLLLLLPDDWFVTAEELLGVFRLPDELPDWYELSLLLLLPVPPLSAPVSVLLQPTRSAAAAAAIMKCFIIIFLPPIPNNTGPIFTRKDVLTTRVMTL
jgi:hypothetical protein